MSQAAFENYVPGGRQAASRSGGPAFENYVTGRNLNGGPGGMSNSWDTPFYRNFISGYQSAMDNGSAGSYFLNRKTGIALANQEGVDDSGMRQVVRAGDVYDEGKLVGNVYDQYGGEQADLILGQLWLSGQEQAKGVRVADKRAEVEQDMSARVGRERFDAEVEGIKKEWGDTADWAAPPGRRPRGCRGRRQRGCCDRCRVRWCRRGARRSDRWHHRRPRPRCGWCGRCRDEP